MQEKNVINNYLLSPQEVDETISNMKIELSEIKKQPNITNDIEEEISYAVEHLNKVLRLVRGEQ